MRRFYGLIILFLGICLGLVPIGLIPAGATSASISHSFKSTQVIPEGSLVSLDSGKNGYVQAANSNNQQRLLGVVVPTNGSLLAVNSGALNTIQVATSGATSTLVSDLNGSIAVGDQVAVSPFSGVGMKASAGERYIGLARTAFSAKSPGATPKRVTDKSGKSKNVAVGYINLSIGIGAVPGAGTGNNLNALQGLAKSFTGHIVPTVRIIFSLLILLVTVTALVPLIYGAIYSGIVSIGRNPLAKYEILRSLTSVLLVSVLLIGVAALTVYLLLR